ncbi:MAG TPA: hypothetical protein VGF99_15705, partial [Myxococcota bacterium]
MKSELLCVVVAVAVVACTPRIARPCRADDQCEDDQRCDGGDDDTIGTCVDVDDPFEGEGEPGEGEGEGEGEREPVAAVVVETGVTFSCAIDADRHVQCWGGNGSGQLGRVTDFGRDDEPAAIANLEEVSDLAVGSSSACALGRRDGGLPDVWCWGNAADMGGIDAAVDFDVGVLVQPRALRGGFGRTVVDLDADGDNNGSVICATNDEGVVRCFGAQIEGSGDGFPEEQPLLTDLVQPATLLVTLEGICGLSSSATTAACVKVARGMGLIGCGVDGPCATLNGGEPFSVEGDNTCRVDDGDLVCAGDNTFGVADPAEREALSVAEHTLRSGASDVGVGEQHACAILLGDVWCWGRPLNGATGIFEDDLDTAPCSAELPESVRCHGLRVVQPPSSMGAASFSGLSVHRQRTCALATDGRVMCFG